MGNTTIWQLAAGQAYRPYADIFLKYGVGLIGPGDAGPWKRERDEDEFDLPAACLPVGVAPAAAACLPNRQAQPDQSAFEPIAYANLRRLKKSATELFARMKRP